MAIPGVFKPVKHHGKLLVDGGLVNPLPYDLLADRCDFIIAVDVSGSMERPLKNPDFLDATLGSFDIVQSSLIAERFQRLPPDVYLKPALRDIRILEFNRADDIYAQSVGTRTELRQQLKRIL
jgi:NTE family protein